MGKSAGRQAPALSEAGHDVTFVVPREFHPLFANEPFRCVLADADLLISHPAAAVVGSMAAEVHGVPVLLPDLFPMLLLTEYAALAGMPYMGRRVNPREEGRV